jgi:hypothetical protein
MRSTGSRGGRFAANGGRTMSSTPTFGRYAEIPVDQMTVEQRDGYRFLIDGPRADFPAPT